MKTSSKREIKINMESIKLGKTGYQISRLGLGGCPLGGHGWGKFDRDQAVSAVRKAFESGVNFFDTADIYGLGGSEELLSQALGNERYRMIIASKFGVRYDNSTGKTYKDISPKYVRQALENSLKRLRLEMIPLYYVHWPDGKTPIQETVAELVKCCHEGKIGGIGLSNFSVDEINEAINVANIDAVQVQFSLIEQENARKLFGVVKQHNIALITWGSLAQGMLTGKYNKNMQFLENDRRNRYDNFIGKRRDSNLRIVDCVRQIAKSNNMTCSQTAIRWLLDTPPVSSVLFGAKSAGQVTENVDSCNKNISQNDYDYLNSIANEILELRYCLEYTGSENQNKKIA
jgi:aryl-alcohol dehydrogenase-like predicted oxidoreductase